MVCADLQMFYVSATFLCHCHPVQLAWEINPATLLINDSDQVRLSVLQRYQCNDG